MHCLCICAFCVVCKYVYIYIFVSMRSMVGNLSVASGHCVGSAEH